MYCLIDNGTANVGGTFLKNNMSAIALKKPENVALQLVTNKIKDQLAENHLHAVNRSVKQKVADIAKKPNIDGRFTITFSYEQNLHRTQVLTSRTGYGTQVYKVALSSALNNSSSICWLQKTPKGWEVLLGNGISQSLVNAITTAIESQA